jgi:hypothetical protein
MPKAPLSPPFARPINSASEASLSSSIIAIICLLDEG